MPIRDPSNMLVRFHNEDEGGTWEGVGFVDPVAWSFAEADDVLEVEVIAFTEVPDLTEPGFYYNPVFCVLADLSQIETVITPDAILKRPKFKPELFGVRP